MRSHWQHPPGPPGGFESNRLPFMCVFVRVGRVKSVRSIVLVCPEFMLGKIA